jgi:RNA polymerase sigma factor (sigma-70 family)
MPSNPLSKFIQQVRTSTLLREGAGWSDGQLLASFIEDRDEAAFGALVRLHGPMVWGVCRRVLDRQHDAEDAFQATFLVLLRKAASIVPREMVGNWLYGVAYRTALKARTIAAKRRGRETKMRGIPEPEAVPEDLRNDLQPLLDQELSRLPDKYRVPIVLCDLEGKTQREAAKQVGVPDGTLSARLFRARSMLAKRLTRHGLSVSAAALGTVMSECAVKAAVPTAVVSSTIKAASLLTAGQTVASGIVSPAVAALSDWVIKMMLLNKLTKLTVVALLAMLAFGEGLHLRNMAAAQPGPDKPRTDDNGNLGAPAKDADKNDSKGADRADKDGTFNAVLDKVDVEERTITVFRPAMGVKAAASATAAIHNAIRLENLPLSNDARITMNGKEAKLTDLKSRMRVVLELEVKGAIKVKEIRAEDTR